MNSFVLIPLLFFAFFSLGARAPRKTSSLPQPGYLERLKKDIDSLLGSSRLHDLESAVLVYSLDKGEFLYERNPNTALIPASVNKIITTFVALKKLKPTFTFKTTVLATGPLKDGKLAGDLYLKGGGDPSLVSERAWMLVNDFMRSGIRSIAGNIVGDASYFDTENRPSSRPTYLKDQAYNAPVGALSFNFNTTTVYVHPGAVGTPPIVISDPENSYIDIVNQARTGPAGSKNSIHVNRTDYVKGDEGDTVLLRGSIPVDHKEMRFYKNIVNPTRYTAHMIKAFMESRGIQILGKVTEGITPENARLLLDFESQPLWQIIWGMNKFSNNFVADQILKKIGAEVYGAPGSLEKGIRVVHETLEDMGLPRDKYEIVDGSGLTRKTRVTARQLLTVLTTAYRDFSIAPEFVSSLGIAGEDGTLRNRLPSSAKVSTIRAKTGTLDGVSSLAGFTTSGDGEMLAFVILLNDPKSKYGRMSSWIDQIATSISRFSRKG